MNPLGNRNASLASAPPNHRTSANLRGMPTNAQFVRAQLGDQIPLIVDGGPTTIVNLSGGGNTWMIALTLQH
jgi:L-threonylcarbamoyladenylate synthase